MYFGERASESCVYPEEHLHAVFKDLVLRYGNSTPTWIHMKQDIFSKQISCHCVRKSPGSEASTLLHAGAVDFRSALEGSPCQWIASSRKQAPLKYRAVRTMGIFVLCTRDSHSLAISPFPCRRSFMKCNCFVRAGELGYHTCGGIHKSKCGPLTYRPARHNPASFYQSSGRVAVSVSGRQTVIKT